MGIGRIRGRGRGPRRGACHAYRGAEGPANGNDPEGEKELVNLSLLSGLGFHLDRERLYVSQFSAEAPFQERLKKLSPKKG